MTALIIGLIAALGIGGGIAISNSGGGHGGGSTASATVNAASDPVYVALKAQIDNLQEATATDTTVMAKSDRTPTAGNSDLLQEEMASQMIGFRRVGTQSESIYDRSNTEFARIGKLMGHDTIAEDTYRTVNFGTRTGDIAVGRWNEITGEETPDYTLTVADKGAWVDRYDTFKHTYEDPANYTAIHLAGGKTGLTVSDFGRWEETLQAGGAYEDNHYYPFMLYDNTFAYNDKIAAVYQQAGKEQVALQGMVFAEEARGYDEMNSSHRDMLTGDIFLTFNLPARSLIGHTEGLGQGYDKSFDGSFSGSVVTINGTSTQGIEEPNAGDVRGGYGKLLLGKNGLEMVGEMTVQMHVPTQAYIDAHPGQSRRDLYEHGKIDYNFGAREVPQTVSYMTPFINLDLYPHVVMQPLAPENVLHFPLATSISADEPGVILVNSELFGNEQQDMQLQNWVARFAAENFTDENDYYKHFSTTLNTQASLSGGEWRDITQYHDLYLAGAKAGLTAADFGLSNTYRPMSSGRLMTNYQDFILYDPANLYAGNRNNETDVALHGKVIMSLDQHGMEDSPLAVFTGTMSMNLDLANAVLNGSISMDQNIYNIPSFTGTINGAELQFGGEEIEGFGKLLNGRDGMESVGALSKDDIGTYVYGAKEAF